MQQRRLVLLCALLLVTACSLGGGNEENGDTNGTASSASTRSAAETANVTYTGTVRAAGISVYQEGTHRLILNDGRFILLESDDLDLNGYVDEEAEVFGTVRPTVEAGGIIMRVERIQLIGASSSSMSAVSIVSSVQSSVQSAVSSIVPSSVARSSVQPTSSAVAQSSRALSVASTPTSTIPGTSSRIEIMVQEDLAADRWTQRYCSTHIGFCFPVHRNWWFKSFGTTTSSLWHVEISNEDITALGEGPIVVRLVAGALSGATDGSVSVSGGNAVGQRSWTEDRHFEIVADARLEAAVRYITSRIEATEEQVTP